MVSVTAYLGFNPVHSKWLTLGRLLHLAEPQCPSLLNWLSKAHLLGLRGEHKVTNTVLGIPVVVITKIS